MSIRASAFSPPATMPSDATAAALLKTAAEKARCNSCSDDIAAFQDGLCLRRLVEQDLERRDIGVPLDQRRPGTEASDRVPIERPYRRGDPGAVGIDQAGPARIESGEVNLGHRVRGHCRDIGARIEPVIDRVDMDIVDVEEQLAAGAAGNGGDEIPFA